MCIRDRVDIIDAGPCLDCRINNIELIKTNKIVKVQSFGVPKKDYIGLISNTTLKNFRVVRSHYSMEGDKVNLHRSLFKDLSLTKRGKVAINA